VRPTRRIVHPGRIAATIARTGGRLIGGRTVGWQKHYPALALPDAEPMRDGPWLFAVQAEDMAELRWWVGSQAGAPVQVGPSTSATLTVPDAATVTVIVEGTTTRGATLRVQRMYDTVAAIPPFAYPGVDGRPCFSIDFGNLSITNNSHGGHTWSPGEQAYVAYRRISGNQFVYWSREIDGNWTHNAWLLWDDSGVREIGAAVSYRSDPSGSTRGVTFTTPPSSAGIYGAPPNGVWSGGAPFGAVGGAVTNMDNPLVYTGVFALLADGVAYTANGSTWTCEDVEVALSPGVYRIGYAFGAVLWRDAPADWAATRAPIIQNVGAQVYVDGAWAFISPTPDNATTQGAAEALGAGVTYEFTVATPQIIKLRFYDGGPENNDGRSWFRLERVT
jgi:hypothetical protein